MISSHLARKRLVLLAVYSFTVASCSCPSSFSFHHVYGLRCFLPCHSSALPPWVNLMILRKVNSAGLYQTSVANDISNKTSSSPILLQFSVPAIVKKIQYIKKQAGHEKIEGKGKLVESSSRSFTHLCSCRREKEILPSSKNDAGWVFHGDVAWQNA